MSVKQQQTVGQILRQAREKLARKDPANYSQGAVARRLGIDWSMLSYVESGKRNFSAANLQKVARLYDLEITSLLKLSAEEQASRTLERMLGEIGSPPHQAAA